MNKSGFLKPVFLAACLVMVSAVLGAVAHAATSTPTPTATPSPAPSNQTSGTPAPQNTGQNSTGTNAQTQPPTTTNANQQREIDVNSLKPDKTVGELQAEYAKTCFYCAITGRIFASAMLLGERVFAVMAPGVAQFLMAMLGLWILWQAGKLFFPFMPFDRGSVTGNTVLTRILFGIAASAILLMPGGYKIYWNYLYMPIVDGAVSMSNALLKEGAPKGSLLAEVSNVNQCKPTQVQGLTADQARIKDALECQVYNLQKAFTYGLALGVYLFQSGALVTGALLVIAYVAAPFAFILIILAALLHWTFLSVLSPVLLGAAVFPKTRTYTISAIKQMIGSGVWLISASIVAVLSAGMVLYSIQSAYQALGAESVPDWLRNFVVQNPYSKTNNVPLDGSASGGAPGQQRYRELTQSGLMPLPYRDSRLAGEDKVTQDTKQGLATGGFIWPAKGTFTSGYGWRWGRMHRGIDIANSVGTPIIASQSGRVIHSGWQKGGGGYGQYIDIRHPGGWMTRYGHNSRNVVSGGREVEQGQIIAYMGSTGKSTGPHLHFEIHDPRTGGAVNPLPFLQGKKMPDLSGPLPDGGLLDAAAPGGTSFADFVTPLNLAFKATWQILLAAVIPLMLARSVPQTLTSVLGLPKIPAADVPGQVAGGLIRSGMGVALTAVATLGAMLQKAGDAPPEQKKTEDSSALATVPRAADSIATADGANRDPQLAAAYSDRSASGQMALPSAGMREVDPRTATIDVQAVSVADDARMPVMATAKMTDYAGEAARQESYTVYTPNPDADDKDLADQKDEDAKEAQRKPTLAENLAYYTGSALLGIAGGVSAIGRIFGANITYEQFEFGQNNKSANDKTQQSEDKKAAAPTILDRISGAVKNAGDRASSRSSAVSEASGDGFAASQGESGDDDRGARHSSGRNGETTQIAAASRVLESAARSAASGERDQKSENVAQMQQLVQSEMAAAANLAKSLAKNDPVGQFSGDLARVMGLAGTSLNNLDSYQLLGLLAQVRSAAADYESKVNGGRVPTGGGSRR